MLFSDTRKFVFACNARFVLDFPNIIKDRKHPKGLQLIEQPSQACEFPPDGGSLLCARTCHTLILPHRRPLEGVLARLDIV